jgi:hypothetical protein
MCSRAIARYIDETLMSHHFTYLVLTFFHFIFKFSPFNRKKLFLLTLLNLILKRKLVDIPRIISRQFEQFLHQFLLLMCFVVFIYHILQQLFSSCCFWVGFLVNMIRYANELLNSNFFSIYKTKIKT